MLTRHMPAVLGVAAALTTGASTFGAIAEDFDAATWTNDWDWATTTSGGAINWSATQSGSELTLSVLGGSGYDSGTLTHKTGVAPLADGIADNGPGTVQATFKVKWTAGSMRMYPHFRLYNAPGSDDYLTLTFLADGTEVGDGSGRVRIYVNGAQARNENVNVVATEPEGSYGWIRWQVDVDDRSTFVQESSDGVTWNTLRGMDMSGAAYDAFFNDMTQLTPAFIMELKNDAAGAADRSVTFDSIHVAVLPEPASALLLAGAGAVLLARRRG